MAYATGVPSAQGIQSSFNNCIRFTIILLHSWEEVGCNSDIIVPKQEAGYLIISAAAVQSYVYIRFAGSMYHDSVLHDVASSWAHPCFQANAFQVTIQGGGCFSKYGECCFS